VTEEEHIKFNALYEEALKILVELRPELKQSPATLDMMAMRAAASVLAATAEKLDNEQ
jgi:hypothetical protein